MLNYVILSETKFNSVDREGYTCVGGVYAIKISNEKALIVRYDINIIEGKKPNVIHRGYRLADLANPSVFLGSVKTIENLIWWNSDITENLRVKYPSDAQRKFDKKGITLDAYLIEDTLIGHLENIFKNDLATKRYNAQKEDFDNRINILKSKISNCIGQIASELGFSMEYDIFYHEDDDTVVDITFKDGNFVHELGMKDFLKLISTNIKEN